MSNMEHAVEQLIDAILNSEEYLTKKAPLLSENLTDDAFVRIVKKHGADKILFATDSPWEDQADYIRRIHEMPLTPEEEINILGKNATKLLQL